VAAEPLTPLTPRSSRVKAARKLHRRASRTSARRFLAEGPQAVREAARVRGCVVEVFAEPGAERRHRDIAAAVAAAGAPWTVVDAPAIGGLAETVAPQGIVAVCAFVDVDLRDLPTDPRLVAVCVDVRDPGNAGVVVRCADAAGADAVILAGASVDPYNGKSVRSSAGSLFHLPVVAAAGVAEVVGWCRNVGLRLLAADAGGGSLDDEIASGRLTAPTAWLFGNEAHGLSDADAALADAVVGVPVYGRAESLNLATAAAVCLYASARAQRAG
jgi:TrmH family RNA methyltransferase